MGDFGKGMITGAFIMLAMVVVIAGLRFLYNRERKIFEYREAQHALQAIQEDINNRPLDEFLEDPGVRGAADNAREDFRRKRDEAVQRIRSRLSSGARLAD